MSKRIAFAASIVIGLGLFAGTAFGDAKVCQGTHGSAKVSVDPETVTCNKKPCTQPRAALYSCKMSVGIKRLDFCTKASTGNDKPEKIEVKVEYGDPSDPKKLMTDKIKVNCKKKT